MCTTEDAQAPSCKALPRGREKVGILVMDSTKWEQKPKAIYFGSIVIAYTNSLYCLSQLV